MLVFWTCFNDQRDSREPRRAGSRPDVELCYRNASGCHLGGKHGCREDDRCSTDLRGWPRKRENNSGVFSYVLFKPCLYFDGLLGSGFSVFVKEKNKHSQKRLHTKENA